MVIETTKTQLTVPSTKISAQDVRRTHGAELDAIAKFRLGRSNIHRFYINGYQEEGTMTTPFDMNVHNGTSRYHLIMQAIRLAAARNPRVAARASERVSHYEYVLADHGRYIQAHGVDPKEITEWKWRD